MSTQGPEKQLRFVLFLGVEEENWFKEGDEFTEWLQDQLQKTNFPVAVDGPVSYLDYSKEEPLQREWTARGLIRSSWG